MVCCKQPFSLSNVLSLFLINKRHRLLSSLQHLVGSVLAKREEIAETKEPLLLLVLVMQCITLNRYFCSSQLDQIVKKMLHYIQHYLPFTRCAASAVTSRLTSTWCSTHIRAAALRKKGLKRGNDSMLCSGPFHIDGDSKKSFVQWCLETSDQATQDLRLQLLMVVIQGQVRRNISTDCDHLLPLCQICCYSKWLQDAHWLLQQISLPCCEWQLFVSSLFYNETEL